MSNELQKKLYNMEVDPPVLVWNKLSLALDEINSDNRIARKMEDSEVDPGLAVWDKIVGVLDEERLPFPRIKRAPVVTLKRITVAALLTGIIASSYFLFFNKNSVPAVAIKDPVQIQESKESTIPTTPDKLSIPVQNPKIIESLAQVTNPGSKNYNPDLNKLAKPSKLKTGKTADVQYASASTFNNDAKLEEKTFTQSLDDLSLVASNTGYMTMVSADGRLVNIPSKYSAIAPYMQDKSEDNYLMDFLIDEGSYWKDKFREWRQKLATSAVTPSENNFFDIISLLKTIQDN